MPTPQNGWTHSNNSSAKADELSWVFDQFGGLALKGLKKLLYSTHWLYSWTIFPCFNSSWKYSSSDIVGKLRYPVPNTWLCKCETNFNLNCTKMKFSITDFFSKCDQIGRPYLYPLKTSAILKKSLYEKFIFCGVLDSHFHLKNAPSISTVI